MKTIISTRNPQEAFVEFKKTLAKKSDQTFE